MNTAEPSRATTTLLRMLAGAVLISIIGTALIGLFKLITGDDDDAPMLGAGLLCVAYFGILLVAATSLRTNRLHILFGITATAGAVSLLGWILMAFEAVEFFDQSGPSGTAKLCILGTAIMLAGTHAARMSCIRTRSIVLSGFRWTVVAMMSTALCSYAVLFMIAEELERRTSMMYILEMIVTLIGIGGLLALLGTGIVPAIAWSMNRREKTTSESFTRAGTIQMECPKCAAAQTFQFGPARCEKCAFTMMIEIQEPRCECGYLLYQLQADTCPECGRPVSRTPISSISMGAPASPPQAARAS